MNIKCKSCGGEYSSEFSYCPFCGKKKAKSPRNVISLYRSLPLLSDEQLSRAIKMVSEADSAAKQRELLSTPFEPVIVYVIRVKTQWGETYGRHKAGDWRNVELARIADFIEKPYSNVKVTIWKETLTNSTANLQGRFVFRTKEEAVNTLKENGFKEGDWEENI